MDPAWEATQTPLLQSLTREEVRTCLQEGTFKTRTYGRNQPVHFSGEICWNLEIILSGSIVVERIDGDGNLMTIAEFLQDDILGGNLLFSKNPHYPMTITAKTPAVILEISKERLFQLFTDHPDFLRKYLECVSDHAAILGDKIKHYVNRTIRDSLLSYLAYERKKQQSNHVIIGISKKALAERIGVQRTSVSRELAKMQADGLIRFDRDTITLLQPAVSRRKA